MIDLENELFEILLDITRKGVQEWTEVVNKIGLEINVRQEWVNIFIHLIRNQYKKCIDEITQHQNNLCTEIEDLLKQSYAFCKQLHLEFPDFGEQHLTLYKTRNILKQQAQKYENMLEIKLKEIEEFNAKELRLCKALDKPTKSLSTSPLPSPDTVKDFYNYLETLEFELDELIETLREKMQSLWRLLNIDSTYSNEFLQNHNNNSISTLEALQQEINKCNILKLENIEMFVKAARKKICDLWSKCRFTDVQRNFEFFNSNIFNEESLSIHELEIEKLEKYYTDNQKILNLLDKRENTWKQMLKLEQQSFEPGRFKNRGGQLLKEERQRKALLKQIFQMEDQLLDLCKTYKSQHGQEFLSWGETVDSIIFNDREKCKKQNKLKLSAEKVKRNQFISEAGPSRIKPLTPTNIKCTQPSMEQNKKGIQTAPPKVYVNGKPVGSSKESLDCAKHIKDLRETMQENVQKCLKYGDFEDEIQQKENCRSTILLNTDETESLALPLPITPGRSKNETQQK